MSNPIAKAAAAALAGAALLAAGAAQAQSSYQGSGYQGSSYAGPGSAGYNYDPCRRDANQRGVAGALIGGGMGAVIGSNAAARNARTEGALLGGLLGAIAGGVIGNKSAACTNGYSTASAPLPPPPLPPRADAPYYDRDAYADSAAAEARDDAWRDRELEPERRVTERPADAEDCRLAESPIYMPDGRTQTRFVRVCRDASGKYAVVD